jgi:hypothetical protein
MIAWLMIHEGKDFRLKSGLPLVGLGSLAVLISINGFGNESPAKPIYIV